MADDSNNLLLSAPGTVKDRVSELKCQLEGWREILLPVHSVLTWQRPFYPLITWAVITLLFLIFYLLSPSLLTTIGLVGIVLVLLDYFMPVIQEKFFDRNHWTGEKERKFEEVCYGLVCTWDAISGFFGKLAEMKRTKPSIYLVAVIVGLAFLAWLGRIVDSLLLTYLIVCVLAMIPGMVSRGYIPKHVLSAQRPLASGADKKEN